MTFGDVAGEAIRFAREGFAVYDFFAESVASEAADYAQWDTNAAIFLPNGRPPAVGERFVQADLAGTLQYMADEERAASKGDRAAGLEAARAAFYTGEIADRIVRFHEAHGGYLTREDLASFRTPREPAVRVRWRDFEVFTCGPWCQGPVLAQALIMLESAGLTATAIDDPDYVHLVIEVLKAAFADREYRYGDPNFVDVRLDELLSADHVAARLEAIDPGTRRSRAAASDRSGCFAGRAAAAAGAEPAGRRTARHVLRLCRRSLGQRLLGHAVRRLVRSRR